MKRLVVLVALLVGATMSPALAQGVFVESYYAYLGQPDHYNSNGVPLTTPAQIIRQDRANFHRFGVRDDGDDWDNFFADASNRARLEQFVENSYFSPGDRNLIVNNEIFIQVDIYAAGDQVTGVNVTVP
jgi:hypothetical protein